MSVCSVQSKERNKFNEKEAGIDVISISDNKVDIFLQKTFWQPTYYAYIASWREFEGTFDVLLFLPVMHEVAKRFQNLVLDQVSFNIHFVSVLCDKNGIYGLLDLS